MVGTRQLEAGDIILLNFNKLPYQVISLSEPRSRQGIYEPTYRMAVAMDYLTKRNETRRLRGDYALVGGPKLLRLLDDPKLIDERGYWAEPVADDLRRDAKLSDVDFWADVYNAGEQ